MTAVLALALAALAAALMGFAIQRGATCTVAAVDELLAQGSATRLGALVEAALWVAGLLLLAHLGGALATLPQGWAPSAWTVAGGLLLGFGAWVNGACVFGAVARFGSGEWAYAAAPLGFWLGCLSVDALFAMPRPVPLHSASPLLQHPALAAGLFVAFALARARTLVKARRWSPLAATTVIGITFFVTLVAAGPWAYTELLADLARGMARDLGTRTLLAALLLAGAVLGGWSDGRLHRRAPTLRGVARCLAGGALMGWGSLLIPGGNDGLILVGMPLLAPYAWIAFTSMCVVIAGATWLGRRRAAFAEG